MASFKVFKTKTGYCHITPDKIILTNEMVIRDMPESNTGDNNFLRSNLFAILAAVLMYFSFKGFQRSEYYVSGIFFVVAGFLLVYIFSIRNLSSAKVILRSSIRDIEFKKAIPGATNAHFIIHFEDKTGGLKRRIIMSSASGNEGDEEIQRAVNIMVEEFG